MADLPSRSSMLAGERLRGSLPLAGAQLLNNLGSPRFPVPGDSMHQSVLRLHSGEPRLDSVKVIRSALERDAHVQRQKYRGGEPLGGTARFHVELPRGPQSTKFSRPTSQRSPRSPVSPGAASTCGLSPPRSPGAGICELTACFGTRGDTQETYSSFSPSSPERGVYGGPLGGDVCPISDCTYRFNIHTVRQWFKDIDAKSTGCVTQRELIVALRKHQVLQALFSAASGLEYYDSQGFVGTGAVDATRDEIRRIKRILADIDTDGSGTMEWPEFLEFFRRSGLLLEYRTNDALNRPKSAEGLVKGQARRASQVRRASLGPAVEASRDSHLGHDQDQPSAEHGLNEGLLVSGAGP